VIAAIGAVVAAAALAYGLLLLHRALPTRPSAFDAALARRRRAVVVESLDRAENLVAISVATAGDVHWRLRPVVRDVAAAALRGRGIELDSDPGAARAMVGEEAWDLIRPDRPRPPDAFAAGIAPAALAGVLDRLEELGR
jgi:hypothetical protein